jgi:hypothetical protein
LVLPLPAERSSRWGAASQWRELRRIVHHGAEVAGWIAFYVVIRLLAG